MSVKIIEQVIEYEGHAIHIRDGKVFVWAFGTTIYNHSMHPHLVELPPENMTDKFKKYLKDNNLI